MLELASSRFADISYDKRVGCIRINAKRHKATILLFNNGHGVVLDLSSKRLAEMAVRYWAAQLDEEGALA